MIYIVNGKSSAFLLLGFLYQYQLRVIPHTQQLFSGHHKAYQQLYFATNSPALTKSMTKNRHFYKNRTSKTQSHRHNYDKIEPKPTTDFQLSQDARQMLEPFAKNLSKLKLTDTQIYALAKGLKHIPRPNKPSRTTLVKDVDSLHRRMRIKYLMRNKKTNSKGAYAFRLPSNWTPLSSGNTFLETYLEKTKEEICHLRFKTPQQNLNTKERQALNELAKNSDIVIKKLDKGRAVCLMDAHDYVQVGLKHLDTKHYELIPEDLTLNTAKLVHALLEEMNDLKHISDDTFIYLSPFSHQTRTSEMYFLPKLHKAPPSDGTRCEIRPILSGINSATYTISKFVDYFLSPLAASQSTFIRDTTDIILKLQNFTFPPNILLASVD